MSEEKISYFVGLDVGTTAVRCVVGELSGEATLPRIIGFSEVSNSGMRKGNVGHIDEVADSVIKAVTEAERMSGQQISGTTVNVNGSHIEGINSKGVIAITSPNRQITSEDRMRVEEAATIVQLPPNKDILQVFAKNYRLDGQDNIKDPVSMHGVRLEVDTHIVVSSTPALKSLNQVLQKAELNANHHTVSSLAAAEVVLNRKQKESGGAVADIGASTTNLVVIEDGEVEHIAVIPMGGTHITNDLAYGLKTELDIAELVKLKHATLNKDVSGQTSFVSGGEEHRFERDTIRMIAEARVEELLDYIDKEFKKIRKSKKLPGGITFVGGTAKLPGLVDFTKESLELPARIGKWNHIDSVVGNLDGLMLLDMYLGPAQSQSYSDIEPGMLTNFGKPLNSIFKRFRKHTNS
jgi:cell division protein FtsA